MDNYDGHDWSIPEDSGYTRDKDKEGWGGGEGRGRGLCVPTGLRDFVKIL